MEDSYTVHRRRKAAARKREKTPDPPRREDEESGEDDNAARAKMEKMVEDTENMAEITGKKSTENITITEGNFKDKNSARDDQGDEMEPTNVETPEQVKNEMASKVETVKKLSSKNEEQDKFRTVLKSGIAEPRDSDLPTPIKAPQIEENKPIKESRVSMEKSVSDERSNSSNKIVESGDAMLDKIPSQNISEPRAKKRSKEKFQAEVKRSYGTDSSDAEERIIPVFIRRKKSPEDESQKILTGSTESRVKSNREKRHVSKHRYSTGTEDELTPKKGEVKTLNERQSSPEPKAKLREKRSVSRHRYPSDTDEDLVMKKSETFPQKCASDKPMIKRSTSEIKKQIIPLSDDSLIQDFAKAQEDYLRRERGILAPDNIDDYTFRSESKILRKRKLGVLHSDPQEMLKNKENEAVVNEIKKTKSWFNWWPFSRKKVKTDDPSPDKMMIIRDAPAHEKVTFMEFLKALQEIMSEFKAYVDQNPGETYALRKLRNCCIGELILIIIYCGLGAFVFRFTEGAFETFYKCGVKRVKRDFLDNLWNYSHNMREEDWKSMARRKLMEFEEQLHSAHEAGVHSYSGQKSWTFLNAVSYCLTVITTIGYGHIAPRTMAGQAITIVYAIFGIPIFLIILADFGKLFTRGIKFLWAFVRRLYYTGSCRKVRRTVPVQEVMKGVQLVYDFATFKRPSQINPEDVEEMQRQQTILNLDGNAPQPETPGTPAMSNFAIDDEFNLPISVAITILLGYIFVGATAYHMFESWDFFESFYFVFISMSTIGFGDFVPKNPIFMMFSIVYLVFGLALTSMCINVVQTVLSDSFKQASQKISATIGFEVPPEEGEENVEEGNAGEPAAVEISDVQATIVKEAEEIREELQAPKAKQEDVHL